MLDYLINSDSTFGITPVADTWFDLGEFAGHHLTNPLTPVARLLLTSDGSMTQMLEALTLSRISMAIERQDSVSPGDDIIELAKANKTDRAIAREAWLTDGKKPLIYAHSLLFASDNEGCSIDSIRSTDKPLGRMLIDSGIRTFRYGCRLGLVKSQDVARHLELSDETEFWGRYYLLSTDRGLKGIIFELFSPNLIEM